MLYLVSSQEAGASGWIILGKNKSTSLTKHCCFASQKPFLQGNHCYLHRKTININGKWDKWAQYICTGQQGETRERICRKNADKAGLFAQKQTEII